MLLERREKDGWRGRTEGQAPEVDGETVLANAPPRARPGDFVDVEITGSGRYDCRARAWEP